MGNIYQGSYCACKDFKTQADAKLVDAACGDALFDVRQLNNKLQNISYISNNVPAEIDAALVRHFHVPSQSTQAASFAGAHMAFAAAGSAPGISSIAAVGTALGSAQNAQRQAVLVKVSAVFLQIQVDLQSRMTYTYSDWSPAQARTPSFGRGEIIIYKPFVTFNINPSLKAYALIHEHAHYARGSWRSITDVGSTWFTTGAYAELDFKKYENLSTEDALRNADCYAWFARELTDTGFYWPP